MILRIFQSVILTITMIAVASGNKLSHTDWQSHSNSHYEIMEKSNYETKFNSKNVPICAISNETSKRNDSYVVKPCNYRALYYPDFWYKFETAYGCFYYTLPSLIDDNDIQVGKCLYYFAPMNRSFSVTCFNVKSGDDVLCYPVDPQTPQVVSEIERVLINKRAVQKWIKCSEKAIECCDETMNDETLAQKNDTCPAIWDGWSCWENGIVGFNSTQSCSEFAYANDEPNCFYQSQKLCYLNKTTNLAEWRQLTDYSSCSVIPRLIPRNNIHIALLATSAAFCTPAIIIMLFYKKLRTKRLAMHRNLLIFIVLRSILLIIIKSVVIHNELTNKGTIMSNNGFWCRFLTTLEKFASSATFTCMLLDGVFLHRRIAAVFKESLNPKIVYPIAAAITLIPIIIWIVLMAVKNDSNCWLVYHLSGIQWVLDVPRITILIINTILLIDILRIILTKLNKKDNTNQLSIAKASLFLMPVFGVQFLFTAWRPTTNSCSWEQAYYIITYVLECLQGILVATLYCYYNKEVHNLIRETYKKTETLIASRFSNSTGQRRGTFDTVQKRETYSTAVPDDDKKANESYEIGNSEIGNGFKSNEPNALRMEIDFDNSLNSSNDHITADSESNSSFHNRKYSVENISLSEKNNDSFTVF